MKLWCEKHGCEMDQDSNRLVYVCPEPECGDEVTQVQLVETLSVLLPLLAAQSK